MPSAQTCVNHSRPLNFEPPFNSETGQLMKGILEKHKDEKQINVLLLADETAINPGYYHEEGFGLVGSVWNIPVQ